MAVFGPTDRAYYALGFCVKTALVSGVAAFAAFFALHFGLAGFVAAATVVLAAVALAVRTLLADVRAYDAATRDGG